MQKIVQVTDMCKFCNKAYTGEHGDGKIFMYELMDTIRISTGQRGPEALCDANQKE